MQAPPGKHVGLLLLVLGGALTLSLIVSASAAARLVGGDYEWVNIIGLLNVGWGVVVLLAALSTPDLVAVLDRQISTAMSRFRSGAQSRHWIWQACLDGILTYSSPGVRVLLGYDPAELVGRSTSELLAPEDRALAMTMTIPAAGSGSASTGAMWRHADGHHVRLIGSVEQIIDEGGSVTGVRGVLSAVEETHAGVSAQRELIPRVIAEARLRIALQPIIDVGFGWWVGAKALARFGPADPPEAVFRRAQEAGLAEDLEAVAAEKAFAVLGALPQSVYLVINLSPLGLVQPAVRQVLYRHRDRLHRIVIEFTQHIRVSDYETVQDVLQPLRRHGLRLALRSPSGWEPWPFGDTGAGYASFLHVVRLRPEMIKLDRALVTDIGTEPAKRAVARAVCALAGELQASVVAEGIENVDDMNSAAELGLLLQQGYGFARPSADPTDWAAWGVQTWPVANRQI